MATNKQGITVRFEDEEMEALDRLAKRYKVSSATIIRWALTALNDYVAANNGRVVLPLDFTEFLARPPRLSMVADAPGNESSPSTLAPSVPTTYPAGKKSRKKA